MKEITLLRGETTLVSDEDFEFLSQWTWHRSENGYVVRREGDATLRMSRIVAERDGQNINKFWVDHFNRNKMDNQRSNLVAKSPGANAANSSRRSHNKSGASGVFWRERTQNYEAYIAIDGTQKYLGRFDDFNTALKVRLEAEVNYYGTTFQ